MLTRERVLELLSYDPETGDFRWKRKHGHGEAGSIAGARRSRGYWAVQIDGKRYYAHRLAWLVCYGSFPKGLIDHINRDKGANWIKNLREATPSQNVAYGEKKVGISGFRGVSFHKHVGKWKAQIRVNYKMIHLGYFENPEIAYQAYKAAALQYRGEFAAF